MMERWIGGSAPVALRLPRDIFGQMKGAVA